MAPARRKHIGPLRPARPYREQSVTALYQMSATANLGTKLLGAPNLRASELVWKAKYAAAGERNVSDTWRRVARAVASVEADPQYWEREFLSILEGFRFLPGGRILAGAGISENATLCNCFVLDRIENSDTGVLEALGETAKTLVAGGGVGVDFSTLSPNGTPRADGPPAPGPVAFLRLWQATAEAFLANAPRRGAMMATLRCDHPDIEAFIYAKRLPGALSLFNLSVQITDKFLAAVSADADWPLMFEGRALRTIRASQLWDKIARAAYDLGEPGLLFVDQIQRENNLWWRERIDTTNPCGEVPLPPNGACDLGSLNLTQFVRDPFTPGASLDIERLTNAARIAVRFLDNVLDLTTFPVPKQAEEARATRRVGLGITGLADALVMLGLTYGEELSLRTAAHVMSAIRDAAYAVSIDLAKEKGAFPALQRNLYLDGAFIGRLPASLRARIKAHGLRNSHLLAIAPTGSISLLAGGVSTGLEPIFASFQRRTIHDERDVPRSVELTDPALSLWRSQKPAQESLPPGFITAWDLPLSAHIDMQAALQPFVDQAISKTWNVGPDCEFEEVEGALRDACRRGLKGFAVFRPGRVREGVLSAAPVRSCSDEATPCE